MWCFPPCLECVLIYPEEPCIKSKSEAGKGELKLAALSFFLSSPVLLVSKMSGGRSYSCAKERGGERGREREKRGGFYALVLSLSLSLLKLLLLLKKSHDTNVESSLPFVDILSAIFFSPFFKFCFGVKSSKEALSFSRCLSLPKNLKGNKSPKVST